jgi:hypothetical protein
MNSFAKHEQKREEIWETVKDRKSKNETSSARQEVVPT